MATDLAGLIRREQENTGASYADIAKRTGLSKAKIGQLAERNPTKRYQVRADTIEKLSLGLRLPLVVVQRAALVTAGVAGEDAERTNHLDLLVSQLERLDPKTLDLISALVDAAIKQQDA